MRYATVNLALASTMHFLVDGVCASCLFLLAGILTDAPAGVAILTYNVVAFMTQPITGWLTDCQGARRDRILRAAVAFLAAAVVMAAMTTVALGNASPLAAAWPLADSSSPLADPSSPLTDASPLASALSAVSFVAVAVVIGAGNSLFHVWGGKQTAVETDNDMRPLGIFVATGGMGLVIGILFHSWPLLATLLALLLATAAFQLRRNAATAAVSPVASTSPAVSVAVSPSPVASTSPAVSPSPASPSSSAVSPSPASHTSSPEAAVSGVALISAFPLLGLAAIMAVVLLRSYFGETFTHGFDKDAALTLAIAATATLGKAGGGWLARWLGLVPMALLLAVGIAASAMLRQGSVPAMLAGIFLINTTMPITLWMANRLLPGREGLAFGLLAAVLVPGYLLAVSL